MAKSRIFLSPPHLANGEMGFVEEAFASNYVAPLGPMVEAFEAEFADFLDLPHCLALSSGTAAMHLALRHLHDRSVESGRLPGNRRPLVLASTLTFIGSVSPACFLDCELHFIDCDLATWNLDPGLLVAGLNACQAAGRPVLAVIPTDLYGQCCNLPELRRICDGYQVPLVVDSAEALGARYRDRDGHWRQAGYHGDCAIYSFNGNKIITTGGGGLLASRDRDLIEHARKLSQQAREPVPWYEHREIGYNYRMSNVLAAIGRGQLRVLEKRVERKREIFAAYHEMLGKAPGVSFMPEAEYNRANRWLTVMLVDAARFGATPEAIRQHLETENIEARPLWKPMHRQPVFQGCKVSGGAISEQLFEQGLCLPSGTAMTDADLERVGKAVLACRR